MKRRKERVYLYRRDDIPSEAIKQISDEWTKSANDYGDVGSCVVGAGIEFTYNGIQYNLSPMSMWQGSCSWEHNVSTFVSKLQAVGCSEVRFNYGTMD